MINDVQFPDELSPLDLDNYLEKGWYRMGQVLFTTGHVLFDESVYEVNWLRYPLAGLKKTPTHTRIYKLNKPFDIVFRPLQLTDELEDLYERYRKWVNFDAPASVENCLFDGRTYNIFQSLLIEIRDKTNLVGAGIFDCGHNAIAGIMNFFDPLYSKFSLGKYLMLVKVDFAKSRGMEWYYPGYIISGHDKFDYKLFLGKESAQILDTENKWVPYNSLTK